MNTIRIIRGYFGDMYREDFIAKGFWGKAAFILFLLILIGLPLLTMMILVIVVLADEHNIRGRR